MMACAGEGDEALVVEPFYTNYSAFATMAGVRLSALTTRVEDGFHLPPREAWEAAVTPKTKLVLLCNPNNPTGTVYSPRSSRWSRTSAASTGPFSIADEVYREFVYDGRRSLSALQLPGFEDLVVVVDSLSKRYSACGIRLGSLATRNREVYQACLRMAQGRLSPPGLAQFVATGASELGPDYTQGVVAEYERRRDLLYRGLKEIPGVFLTKPEGAFYFVARLPDRGLRRLRELDALGLRARRRDRDGRPGARLLRDAGARRERGPHRLRLEGKRPRRVRPHPGRRARAVLSRPAPAAGGGPGGRRSAGRTSPRSVVAEPAGLRPWRRNCIISDLREEAL